MNPGTIFPDGTPTAAVFNVPLTVPAITAASMISPSSLEIATEGDCDCSVCTHP